MSLGSRKYTFNEDLLTEQGPNYKWQLLSYYLLFFKDHQTIEIFVVKYRLR